MENRLVVKAPPQINNGSSLESLLKHCYFILITMFLFSFIKYGKITFNLFLVCITTSILAELFSVRLFKIKDYKFNGSVIISSSLYLFLMPIDIPYYVIIVIPFLMILLGKMLPGGLGKNRFNPTMLGVLLTYIVFPNHMDKITINEFNYELSELFFNGFNSRMIGDIPLIVYLMGAIYLLVRAKTKVSYLFFFLFPIALNYYDNYDEFSFKFLIIPVVIIGLFGVNDPVTTPLTQKGRMAFSYLVGVIYVFLYRIIGLSFIPYLALLAGNYLVKFIDRNTKPRVFGETERYSKENPLNVVIFLLSLVLFLIFRFS